LLAKAAKITVLLDRDYFGREGAMLPSRSTHNDQNDQLLTPRPLPDFGAVTFEGLIVVVIGMVAAIVGLVFTWVFSKLLGRDSSD
jgi:hypothetical protein